jgi:hypothetical protein
MKTINNFALAVLIIGGLLTGCPALQAQTNTNTPPVGTHAHPGFDTIATQLALSDEQKPKVKAVYDEMQQKQLALSVDNSVAPAERPAKARRIRDAATAKLAGILTAEQLAKWRKIETGQRPPATLPQQ